MLKKIKSSFIDLYSKIKERVEKTKKVKIDTPSAYVFETLTPISDSDLGIYKDALDFAFSNDDIRNVAIGPYGAGKSSVLSSYKKSAPRKKFVHVSLAHFDDEEVENNQFDF